MVSFSNSKNKRYLRKTEKSDLETGKLYQILSDIFATSEVDNRTILLKRNQIFLYLGLNYLNKKYDSFLYHNFLFGKEILYRRSLYNWMVQKL